MNEHVRGLLLNRSTVTRALADAMLEAVGREVARDLGPTPRVLVAGGGRAAGGSERFVVRALGAAARTLFCDVSAARRPDVLADLSRPWPFAAGAFDLVVTTWVIEHVPDPRLFVAEAGRSLRAGGTLVCAAPFLYRKHGSPQDYHRFTDVALERLVRDAGLSRVDVRAVGGTPLLCCVNVVWPLIPVPVLGFVLYVLARAFDAGLEALAALLGRSGEVVASYPLGYLCVASRASEEGLGAEARRAGGILSR